MGVSLNQLKKRLQKVNQNKLQKKVEEFVLTDLEIRNLKRAEFKRGELPDGGIIGVYRDTNYQIMKQRMNPVAGGDVDLILTGKFTNQLFVKSLNNSRFIFDSQDEKTSMLKARYTDKIMGLNPETFDKLQKEKYAPKLITYIKRITGL